jgi:hypothetical protein
VDDDARREAQLRGRLRTRGYLLRKDRLRAPDTDHLGGYMLVNASTSHVAWGSRFGLSLDDVEAWLAEYDEPIY